MRPNFLFSFSLHHQSSHDRSDLSCDLSEGAATRNHWTKLPSFIVKTNSTSTSYSRKTLLNASVLTITVMSYITISTHSLFFCRTSTLLILTIAQYFHSCCSLNAGPLLVIKHFHIVVLLLLLMQ